MPTDTIITTPIVTTTHGSAHISIEQQLVESYSEMINKSGIVATIIGVFIFVFIAVLIYLIVSTRKKDAANAATQEKMLNTILDMIKKNGNDNTDPKNKVVVKETNILKMFIKTNSQIKAILNDIRDETNAGRVSVYVFHNGSFSSHALPFYKASCISEVITKNGGIPKVCNVHQNLPLDMFDGTVRLLYNNGHACISNVDDYADKYPYFTGIMRNSYIRACIGVAVYDCDNNILGAIILDFSRPLDDEEVQKYTKVALEKSPMLGPILEYAPSASNK